MRTGDEFSLTSATRPAKLATIIALASGRRSLVELGTATGWTATSLLLADPQRHIRTYDPFDRAERLPYLDLVPAGVRARLRFVAARGDVGPDNPEPVDLLYIDSSHERAQTIAEVRAWSGVLRPGAVIVLDDFDHPDFPGVREAVEELGLRGEVRESLFVGEARLSGS